MNGLAPYVKVRGDEPVVALIYTKECLDPNSKLTKDQWDHVIKTTSELSFDCVYEILDDVVNESLEY
jgi:hypothetical protein